MSQERSNNEVPSEPLVNLTETSEPMKLPGPSPRPSESLGEPAEDQWTSACVLGRSQQPRRSRKMVYAWIAVPALAVVILLGVLGIRRVSNSSASSQNSRNSTMLGAGQEQPSATPSGRIVGYWVNEHRDHVVCFTPIDPDLREGTYAVVRRGNKRAETVRFKVLHEETAGEQLVIQKQGCTGEKLVVEQQGAQVTYRLQKEALEVTFNVAKDGKSMTRLEIVDGEPVMTAYVNAGETADR